MNPYRVSGIVLAGIILLVLGSAPANAGGLGHGKTRYTLTIGATGNGSTYPAAGAHTYPSGARVLVVAIPGFGDRFTGWSGDASGTADPILMVMDGNKAVSATFAQGKSWISKLPNPPGIGVPRPSGAPGNLTVLDWAAFKGAVSYTFDDALDSQIYYYDTLKAPGVPMTFYLNPYTSTSTYTQAERFTAFQQYLADGNELGNHTKHHCNVAAHDAPSTPGALSNCAWSSTSDPVTDDTPESEIADTTAWIEHTIGQDGIWTMASPYGDANWDWYAQQAHFLVQRDVWQPDQASHGGWLLPNDLSWQYHLPVYMAGAPQWGGLDDQESTFDGVIDLARANGGWALFLFHQVGPFSDHDTIGCCEVPAVNIAGSMTHLTSLHDVWGDTAVNVGAYWVGQKLLSSATTNTRRGVTTWTWMLPVNFPRHRYLRVRVDGGTLWQRGRPLLWDEHGYYEVSLDAGSLTLSP